MRDNEHIDSIKGDARDLADKNFSDKSFSDKSFDDGINMDKFAKKAVGSLFDSDTRAVAKNIEPKPRYTETHTPAHSREYEEEEERYRPAKSIRPKKDDPEAEYQEYLKQLQSENRRAEAKERRERERAQAEMDEKLAYLPKKKPPSSRSQPPVDEHRERPPRPPQDRPPQKKRPLRESDVYRRPPEENFALNARHIAAGGIVLVLIIFVFLIFQVNSANSALAQMQEENEDLARRTQGYDQARINLIELQQENTRLQQENDTLLAQLHGNYPNQNEEADGEETSEDGDYTAQTGTDTEPIVQTTPPPTAPTNQAGGNRTHTVAAGETLWRIAELTLGNGNLYSAIIAANPAINPNELHEGTVLIIP